MNRPHTTVAITEENDQYRHNAAQSDNHSRSDCSLLLVIFKKLQKNCKLQYKTSN